MHSKIIQPGKHGRIAYDNKGSCTSLVEYLGHEARENKMPLSFFNSTKESMSAADVKTAIDSNVKGLRKGEVKFYSLVISPSQDELNHLSKENTSGNNSNQKPYSPREEYEQKLQLFSRQVMENYAQHFNLPRGRKLSSVDLQWYATIHYHRQYKSMHQEVKVGEAKVGSDKPGANAHVHIIVSKRDLSQQVRLNPQGSKEHFSIQVWQKENQVCFNKIFSYHREEKKDTEKTTKLTNEQKERFYNRISGKVSLINAMLEEGNHLLQKKVEQIAEKKAYSQTFFYNLNRLETNLRKGQPVADPLHLLEYNKDKKPERLEGCNLGDQIEKTFKVLAGEKITTDENLSMPDIKSRYRRRTHPDYPEQKAAKRSAARTM